jgi:hypothetical protein
MSNKIPAEFWQWAFAEAHMPRQPKGSLDNQRRTLLANKLNVVIWQVIKEARNGSAELRDPSTGDTGPDALL